MSESTDGSSRRVKRCEDKVTFLLLTLSIGTKHKRDIGMLHIYENLCLLTLSYQKPKLTSSTCENKKCNKQRGENSTLPQQEAKDKGSLKRNKELLYLADSQMRHTEELFYWKQQRMLGKI